MWTTNRRADPVDSQQRRSVLRASLFVCLATGALGAVLSVPQPAAASYLCSGWLGPYCRSTKGCVGIGIGGVCVTTYYYWYGEVDQTPVEG